MAKDGKQRGLTIDIALDIGYFTFIAMLVSRNNSWSIVILFFQRELVLFKFLQVEFPSKRQQKAAVFSLAMDPRLRTSECFNRLE